MQRGFVAAGSWAAVGEDCWHLAAPSRLPLLNLRPVKQDWLVCEQAKCPPSAWALAQAGEAAKASLLIIKRVYKGKARSQQGPTGSARASGRGIQSG